MRRALVVPLLAVALLCAASAQAEKRDLKIEGKMPADYVAAQAGRAWAVVIGIDEYEKAPRLKYAVADAKAMAGLLQQQGFQVTGLYDKQATRNAIVGELGDKLSARVGEQDRVVIFYAGHGETKKARGGKEMGFLIPVNGQQEALAETGISMGLIRELSDALPSKQVLFLVDVCYGGIAGQQFRSMPPMTEDYLRIITRERGRQLITAGGADQQAMEAPEWGHSVFTYYLLEGLGKGFADLNNDGIIPASELYSYLDSRVFGAAKLKGHTQRPELWALAAEKGEFVFLAGKESKGSQAAPSAALTQAEQELKALEEQERQVEEQQKLAAVQQQIEEKKQQVERKKQEVIQEARVRPPSAPRQMGREITGKDGAPMALVPAGEFIMGSNEEDDERPVHRMYVDAFYMDKYEVTNGRYIKFIKATGTPGQVGDDDYPVLVDWNSAEAYCRWANKRLPTEAEWEKSARGSDGRIYPWGNEELSESYANYGTSGIRQRKVGGYEAGKSPYGIYDLAGNVWEWVADWYHDRYYQFSPDRNPSGPPNGIRKVIRGGSLVDGADFLRSAKRGKNHLTNTGATPIGFRCAQDAR